jgi:hypothetical protein
MLEWTDQHSPIADRPSPASLGYMTLSHIDAASCPFFLQVAEMDDAIASSSPLRYLSVCQIRASPPSFLPLCHQLPPSSSLSAVPPEEGSCSAAAWATGRWRWQQARSFPALLSFYLRPRSFFTIKFSLHSLFAQHPECLNQAKATPYSPNSWRPQCSSLLLAPTLKSRQSDVPTP